MDFCTLTIDVAATGKRIAQARVRAGLSVKELQVSLGFSAPNAIYKWQRGGCLPSLDHLIILSAILEKSLDELVVVTQ